MGQPKLVPPLEGVGRSTFVLVFRQRCATDSDSAVCDLRCASRRPRTFGSAGLLFTLIVRADGGGGFRSEICTLLELSTGLSFSNRESAVLSAVR